MLANELWDDHHPDGRLRDEAFAQVVRCAPLVCVDIIIRGPLRRILVGRRENEPARGWHFVPGGRVRKDEKICDAFHRILLTETAHDFAFGAAHFAGVFEHFYPTNACGGVGFGTHCVTLGYEIVSPHRSFTPDRQHGSFKWLTEQELLTAADVHDNTKAYFRAVAR